MVDGLRNSVAGAESLFAALKPTMMRVGGYKNDAHLPDPFNEAEFDRMMAHARAIGADPIVQVALLQDNDVLSPCSWCGEALAQVACDHVIGRAEKDRRCARGRRS